MKTIADFKRALTLGSKWQATWHSPDGAYTTDLGTRKVGVVKSNRFGFERIGENGEIILSWCEFPKAANFAVNDKGQVEIYHPASEAYNLPRRLALTYTKL